MNITLIIIIYIFYPIAIEKAGTWDYVANEQVQEIHHPGH